MMRPFPVGTLGKPGNPSLIELIVQLLYHVFGMILLVDFVQSFSSASYESLFSLKMACCCLSDGFLGLLMESSFLTV
jgi:hypothetical protein